MKLYIEMKLLDSGLIAIKRIYNDKIYEALSGEEFMDIFRELQRKGKIDQKE